MSLLKDPFSTSLANFKFLIEISVIYDIHIPRRHISRCSPTRRFTHPRLIVEPTEAAIYREMNNIRLESSGIEPQSFW